MVTLMPSYQACVYTYTLFVFKQIPWKERQVGKIERTATAIRISSLNKHEYTGCISAGHSLILRANCFSREAVVFKDWPETACLPTSGRSDRGVCKFRLLPKCQAATTCRRQGEGKN